MNRRAIWKEFRALLPLWIACAITVAVRGIAGGRGFNGQAEALAVLGYITGSLALGAHAFGHEYSDRTLQSLLVQPVSRRRLLLSKLGTVAVLLLLLNALRWIFPSSVAENRDWPWYLPGLLAFCSLSIAPWLTMVCVSSIAGIVLTAALPGTLWVAISIFFLLKDGAGSHVVDRSVAILPWAMLAVCAFAAVETWRRFMRLEAAERRADIRLPHWARRRARSASADQAGPASRRSPVWMLIKKELFLQQMSLVVAGLYGLCWVAATLMERFVPDFPVDFPLLGITMLYFALLSIVIGSLASAEERQFGTLPSQLLLPMSMRRQWFIKMMVVLGAALVLGVGLPIALSYLHVVEDVRVQGTPPWNDWWFVARMATTIVVITSCAVYLSSVSTGGVRALVLVVPTTFVAAMTLPAFMDWSQRLAYHVLWGSPASLARRGFQRSPSTVLAFVGNYVWIALAFGLIALLLRFALENHRSVERSRGRLVSHGASIVGYVLGSIVLGAWLQMYLLVRFN